MGEILSIRVILILVAFAVFVGLMVAKKLPTILALPLLGVLTAVIAGVPFMTPAEEGGQTIMSYVIGSGASRLAGTIIATIFGGMFAKVIQKQGISDAIIRKAAELAGDKPYAIAFVLTAATALIFSAIGGAGPVIMVSTIVIPLMLSAGIQPVVAAGLVLFGISTGGLFNVANYQFYVDTIGMDMDMIKSASIVMGIASVVAIVAYVLLNVKRTGGKSYWAKPAAGETKEVNVFALLAPLVPILLVFVFQFTAELSLIIAVIYTILVTNPRQIIQVASSSLVEGIQDVAGVTALMIGIGILLNGVSAEATVALMQPLIGAIMPRSAVVYVIAFTILSPLALYRGPLNSYGLGSGLANIMLAAGTMSPAAVGNALRATGVVQGVSDPTNTQNVIVADYAKVDVNAILKSTLPYTIFVTFVALVYTAVFYF
ncbi:transporter [Allofournierella massiliensis]|uniref:Transporter n=1 Tax=Allofournierella massiliensis TaxID=1650663 RepID=A0ABT7UQI1_9FIRM|nr:transporter [Fournierella massiliensis]MDM8201142.1 transporter [Fournierella massiliensis]